MTKKCLATEKDGGVAEGVQQEKEAEKGPACRHQAFAADGCAKEVSDHHRVVFFCYWQTL
jgi:hypothetical protein